MNDFLTNKAGIIAWLDKYEINNYILVPDKQYGYVVDVKGEVNLYNKELTNIPIKFNIVMGDFDCSFNKLTSLEFCPKKVGGDFHCSNNQLHSLEFCPQTVKGVFYCNDNSGLGDLQKIQKFSIIYQEHLKYKEKKDLAHKLEKELVNNIKSTKIKI